MGSKYVDGYNPFHDFLFVSLMCGVDIANKEVIREVQSTLSNLLENYLNYEEDVKFLDFKIIKNQGKYRVVGKNIISALWLSGIIPSNTLKVMKENKLVYRDFVYTFNEKKFKLNIKKLKN